MLYKKCNEKPPSTHILESIWRLFGHILRRNEEIPANKAMQLYFHCTEKRFRGRPTTTLPVIINKDLSQIQDNPSLKSTDDLKYLRSLEQDRDQWKSLTKQIVEIAEASWSSDQDAKSELVKYQSLWVADPVKDKKLFYSHIIQSLRPFDNDCWLWPGVESIHFHCPIDLILVLSLSPISTSMSDSSPESTPTSPFFFI